MDKYRITVQDLAAAKKMYEEDEPRSLFYHAATALVALAVEGKAPLTVAQALAVLLQTWNVSYYRFHGFSNQHLADIQDVVKDNLSAIAPFKNRSIASFASDDEAAVTRIFNNFERVLKQVGAAKSLHLLAPGFFPLWDGAIAVGYGLRLKGSGNNASRYLRFMEYARDQVKELSGKVENPLKAIDECNYCRYTLAKKKKKKPPRSSPQN
jgi:hypothetical protein